MVASRSWPAWAVGQGRLSGVRFLPPAWAMLPHRQGGGDRQGTGISVAGVPASVCSQDGGIVLIQGSRKQNLPRLHTHECRVRSTKENRRGLRRLPGAH